MREPTNCWIRRAPGCLGMDVTVAYLKGDDRELGVPTHNLGRGSTVILRRWRGWRNSTRRRILI